MLHVTICDMSANKKIKVGIIYLIIFLFTLHTTPTLYINSSFLGDFIKDENLGLLYIVSSILTIISLLLSPYILRRFGNFKTFIFVTVVEILAMFAMAFSDTPSVIVGTFLLSNLARALAFFSLDIFLEHNSQDKDTGNIRGLFLTIASMATLLGPLTASLVLVNQNFRTLYILSAVIMLPVLFIAMFKLKSFKDSNYHPMKLIKTTKRILNDIDLYGITAASILLHTFFSWMVIYLPIYLHKNIGLSFPEVTIIIAIALLPFILFDVTWGWLADKKIGEKELLIVGFIIMAMSTGAITFISTSNIVTWSIILFMTRVGASMVETMIETYMFKKIDDGDADMLSFFRITQPLSYVIGPALASILLVFIDFKFIFLVLGAIVLYGIRYSLIIKDTR